MHRITVWFSFLLLISGLFTPSVMRGNPLSDQKHIEVAMRMIGHKILQMAGDSTSLVLPISGVDGVYTIGFDTQIGINPDDLASVVSKVAEETGLPKRYFAEVQSCDSGEVVYAFEKGNEMESDIMPCRGRDLPKACYTLVITLPDSGSNMAEVTQDMNQQAGMSSLNVGVLLTLLLLMFGGAYVWFRKRNSGVHSDLIQIGGMYFDRRNGELRFEDKKIKLTGKEADLLQVLYEEANVTVERDIILNRVWGDEGDYVGRTLDVFISKLRKKLELDPALKIENIRGVGYKLILN